MTSSGVNKGWLRSTATARANICYRSRNSVTKDKRLEVVDVVLMLLGPPKYHSRIVTWMTAAYVRARRLGPRNPAISRGSLGRSRASYRVTFSHSPDFHLRP